MQVPTATPERSQILRRGRQLEYVTIVVACSEAATALVTGFATGSIALVGFGIDSLIEVISGGALLWRFHHDGDVDDRERAERTTLRVVGTLFFLLAAYVMFEATRSLFYQERPDRSLIGIFVLMFSFLAMILLSQAKRRVASQLRSAAMYADASQTALCSYLSAISLVGIALNAVFGWWWADPLAALGMVPIIALEGTKAFKGESCSCAGACN